MILMLPSGMSRHPGICWLLSDIIAVFFFFVQQEQGEGERQGQGEEAQQGAL